MRKGSAEIAGIIRREIHAGEMPPNERLPAERQLAESYGVARGTVRAALTILEGEGLVETRLGSGTYICGEKSKTQSAMESAVAEARPLELMDARFALEPHNCRLAVLEARGEDIKRAASFLTVMENSVDDPVAFAEADKMFHKLLAEMTGNGLLEWFMSQISGVRNEDEWARMRLLTLNEETIRIYNEQHRAILDAIQSRDPETAAKRMKEHLETARISLTRAAST